MDLNIIQLPLELVTLHCHAVKSYLVLLERRRIITQEQKTQNNSQE